MSSRGRRKRERAQLVRAQEMCKTCAYRPGTDAYEARLGRPREARDAELKGQIEACLAEGRPFYCHDPIPETPDGYRVPDLDDDGNIVREQAKLCVPYMTELRRHWKQRGEI